MIRDVSVDDARLIRFHASHDRRSVFERGSQLRFQPREERFCLSTFVVRGTDFVVVQRSR